MISMLILTLKEFHRHFIFSCFLLSYMTVRMSTTVPWPNPSEVFALRIGGQQSQSLDSGRRCLEHRYHVLTSDGKPGP